MKYKIAICDDEQNQIEYISSIVSMWEKQLGCVCDISTFHSAEAFLFDYWEDRTYDILLLDVEMKNMNGIELAKRIRKRLNYMNPRFSMRNHFYIILSSIRRIRNTRSRKASPHLKKN